MRSPDPRPENLPQDGIRSFHTLPAHVSFGDAAGTSVSGEDGRGERPSLPNTVLEHLVRRFPSVGLDGWTARMGRGLVSWDDGTRVDRGTVYAPGRRLVYLREVPGEPEPDEPVRILHLDDEIVVADKVAGIPVTPVGRYVRRSLLAQVRSAVSNPEITPAHRIDKDTAGLVLFVQRPEDRATYQGLFSRRQVHKVYEAIGRGETEPPAFTTVRSRIERTEDPFRWRSVPDPLGPARSDVYRGTGTRSGSGSAEWRFRVVPESGRPHQVRLHLAQLGFPLVGDSLYPERRAVGEVEGPLCLLAAEIWFRDPRRPRWRFFRSRLSLPEPR